MAAVADRLETTLFTREDAPSGSRRRMTEEEPATPLVARAVGRAREGDRDALRFLYVRYADEVYGYALKIVSDHDRAREVTRRLFAELEELIGRYGEHDAPFGAWLRRITRTLAADLRHR